MFRIDPTSAGGIPRVPGGPMRVGRYGSMEVGNPSDRVVGKGVFQIVVTTRVLVLAVTIT
jgi:hypothetical protein